MYLPQVKKYWALLPFSWLYEIGVRFRNYAFEKGWLCQQTFDIPIICVGNVAVGGTGKTPHTEYILNLLLRSGVGPIAVLSRGYKRKSKGFLLATPGVTARALGDESFQLYGKFPGVMVAVDADRRNGIKRLLSMPTPPQVIVLDDAYQHRYVKAGLSICLTSYSRILYKDRVLPVGRLREPKEAIRRADMVVVTKCPCALREEERVAIQGGLPTGENQFICYSAFQYCRLVNLASGQSCNLDSCTQVLMVTGIADPSVLEQYIQSRYRLVEKMIYSDHHHFSTKEISAIYQKLLSIDEMIGGTERDNQRSAIITTEKDAVRLKEHPGMLPELKERIFVLPAEVVFIANTGNRFDQKIMDYVQSSIKTKI